MRYPRSVLVSGVMLLGLLLPTTVAQAGPDVAPGQTGFEPNNAVVNPRNPSQVAVARGCQIRLSNDFGRTFPVVRNSTLGCNGDPSMAFDSQGRLFISHLTRMGAGNELTVVAGQIADTTTAGTLTYTPAQISQTDGNDDDKQWMAADANPGSSYRDNLYLVWTQFSSPTVVLFSRSTDQGANWSAPQQISAAGEGFVWPTHIAVGPNGDVYTAYHTDTCGSAGSGAIPLLRDGSGGADFAAGNVPQKSNAFAPGQATVTCNVQDGSGDEIPGADFWLQGSMQPWILPDPLRPGHVYVVGNDDPDDAYRSGDDADVVIARSTDFGVSFTVGRVDSGPGQTFAVMPTAHIDQDGNLAVQWYDNRRGLMNTGANANADGDLGNANFLLDVYGTTSRDGAMSFTNDFRISDSPFDPDAGSPCRFGARATNDCTERIGEYNGVWTVDGIGYATWTGNATPPAAPFPSDGGGAQTTMFDLFSLSGAHLDRLEPNEAMDAAVVAVLGANDTYNEPDLTLHSATDVDVFKVTALHSGTLSLAVQFNELISDLEATVQDASGDLIATSTLTTVRAGNSVERMSIPVVAGQDYFVQVLDPDAPNTLAPQSSYDLTIVNRPAPVPFALDLVASSDSGRDHSDDVTNDDTPTIRLQADTVGPASIGIDMLTPTEVMAGAPGFALAVFRDGSFAGHASPVAGTSERQWEFTFPTALADGRRVVTAMVEVFDGATPQASGFGGESNGLSVTIDTVAPAKPAAPDLLGSSDGGGIDDDDVTTIATPAFQGSGEEANALIRLAANGTGVGRDVVTSAGAYTVAAQPLDDGVYDMTATLEDLAGNVSAPSDPLLVTIARYSLTLPGLTTAPAGSEVVVDLQAGTVSGYPGVPSASGMIGIVGIPTVRLDANGHGLTVLGTSGDDRLRYTPTGGDAGVLSREGSSQVLDLSAVGGPFRAEPGTGTDELLVIGTVEPDAIGAVVDQTMSVQVGSLLAVSTPNAETEQLSIASRQGVDEIVVSVFDTVSASLSIDGGSPSSNPRQSDRLRVGDHSGRARIRNQPSSLAGAGLVLVEYPRTTGNTTTVAYADVEDVKRA